MGENLKGLMGTELRTLAAAAPAAGATSIVLYGPIAVQEVNCTDSGDGNKGAVTVTPTSGAGFTYIDLTVLDEHGCNVTISETGATRNTRTLITNVSAAYTMTLTTISNQQLILLGSPKTYAANESTEFKYSGAQWIQTGHSTATENISSMTVGNGTTSAGFIYFLEDGDNGTNTVQLIGPASTADVVVTLPAATGRVALTTHTAQYAATPVIDDPDNFAANFTGDNLYGGTFIANAAGTAALPDPAVGMNFTYVLEGANANIIDPLGTGTADTIVMNGLAAAADENITSSTSGAMCVFQYRAANSWMATCNGFVEATPP